MKVEAVRKKVVPVVPPLEKLVIELDPGEAALLAAFLESMYMESENGVLDYKMANDTFRMKVREAAKTGIFDDVQFPEKSLKNRIITPICTAINASK